MPTGTAVVDVPPDPSQLAVVEHQHPGDVLGEVPGEADASLSVIAAPNPAHVAEGVDVTPDLLVGHATKRVTLHGEAPVRGPLVYRPRCSVCQCPSTLSSDVHSTAVLGSDASGERSSVESAPGRGVQSLSMIHTQRWPS